MHTRVADGKTDFASVSGPDPDGSVSISASAVRRMGEEEKRRLI